MSVRETSFPTGHPSTRCSAPPIDRARQRYESRLPIANSECSRSLAAIRKPSGPAGNTMTAHPRPQGTGCSASITNPVQIVKAVVACRTTNSIQPDKGKGQDE